MIHWKRYILSLLFFAMALTGHGSDADSLRTRLNEATQDSVRCRIFLEMGDLFEFTTPDSAFYFYFKSLNLSRTAQLRDYEVKSLRYIGYLHANQGNYDQALEYYTSSLNVAKEITDSRAEAMAYNNIGIVYHDLGIYDKAVESYMKALAIFEGLNDLDGMSMSFNNIGIIHRTQGNYDTAIDFYLKSLELYKQKGDKKNISINYNNIGLAYFDQISLLRRRGNHDLSQQYYAKALEYYQKSLEINRELKDQRGTSASFNNLGMLYHDQGKYARIQGDLSQAKKDFDTAIEYYNESLKIDLRLGDKNWIAIANKNIADLYVSLADIATGRQSSALLKTALEYGQKAYNLALEIGVLPVQNDAAAGLQTAHTYLGEYSEALNYAQIVITLRDSIFNLEKTTALAEMQARYETEKKQQEIDNQQLIIDKQEAEFVRQKNQRNFLAIASVFIFIIALVSIVSYVTITRKNLRLKIANEKLASSEENSRVLVKTKDRLYSIIAHDLKSPVTSLVGLTDMMIEDMEHMTREEILECSRLVHDSSSRLKQLVDNLLHWAQSQTGKIILEPDEISIGNITFEVVSLMENQAKSKGVDLVNEVPKNLKVYGDKNTIATVMRNLVSNAIKYTGSDGKVTLSAEKNNGKVLIKIADTGVGIHQANLKKLFKIDESFSTRGTNNESGTGLGLIVCKEFTECNGGGISVDSAPGHGTTFVVSLPANKKERG